MKRKELTEKMEVFCSLLEKEDVKYVFLCKNNKDIDMKAECSAGDFFDMLEEFASRLSKDNAVFIGAHITTIGLALLKKHDKRSFDIVKKNIAKI